MLSRYKPLYPYKYIVVLLTVTTLPINYYTQRGWHISEVQIKLYFIIIIIIIIDLLFWRRI